MRYPEKRHSAILNYRLLAHDTHHPPLSPSYTMQTLKHITETVLLCQLSPHNLINCHVQKADFKWLPGLYQLISGQITANIQENLARLIGGNLKLILDSKKRYTRLNWKGKAAFQLCKPWDAKVKCLPRSIRLPSAFPPALGKHCSTC